MNMLKTLSLVAAFVLAGCSGAGGKPDEVPAESQGAALLDEPVTGDLDSDCFDACVESFGGTSSPAAQRALEKGCLNSCTK